MRIAIANLVAIYRRELQSYFRSPLAYAIAGIFWLLAGFFFTVILLGPEGLIQQAAIRDTQGQQMGIPVPPVDLAYEFLRVFLGLMGSLSLFVLPILSMGLYAEERKRGTLELLATSPVTNWIVAAGKLLGVVTFYGTMVLPLLLLELFALSRTDPAAAWAVPVLGHVGLLLLAASVLSLGMFVSSLTDSTLLAAILTFALVLFLWVIDLIANGLGGAWGGALGHLSLLNHYETWVKGVLDTQSLVLFGSYIFLGIFLTAQSIETFRFQRS